MRRARRTNADGPAAVSGLSTVFPSIMVLAMAGCASGPSYAPPTPIELGAPEGFTAAPAAATSDDIRTWWSFFGDPLLSELITQSLGGNLDIAQAAARVRSSREALVQAQAGSLPSLSLSQSAARSSQTGATESEVFSMRADAQWVVDLFGATRRGVEASRASLEAAGFRQNDIAAAAAAETARNYFNLITTRERIRIARETLTAQDSNLEIAGFRLQAGLASALDVEQARAQRAATAASLPALERSEATYRYRLSVLTGGAPGTIDGQLAGLATIPELKRAVRADAPANVLRRRPDVRAAERSFAAATALIGAARARLYPSVTLSGSLGSSALSLGSIGDIVSDSLVASLVQPLFQGGSLRSAVLQREASADEAFAAYRLTVLVALEEVENALIAREAASARLGLLTDQVDAASAAAALARESYRAGLTDFQRLLDTERSLLSARDGRALAQGEAALSDVQLFLALGGGWTPPDENGVEDGRR
jgi:outer membrane protein, multidrug efflux system